MQCTVLLLLIENVTTIRECEQLASAWENCLVYYQLHLVPVV